MDVFSPYDPSPRRRSPSWSSSPRFEPRSPGSLTRLPRKPSSPKLARENLSGTLKLWKDYAAELEARIRELEVQSTDEDVSYWYRECVQLRFLNDELRDELRAAQAGSVSVCKECGAGKLERARQDAERAAREAREALESTRRRAVAAAQEEALLAKRAAHAADEAELLARAAIEARQRHGDPTAQMEAVEALARQARNDASQAVAAAKDICVGTTSTEAAASNKPSLLVTARSRAAKQAAESEAAAGEAVAGEAAAGGAAAHEAVAVETTRWDFGSDPSEALVLEKVRRGTYWHGESAGGRPRARSSALSLRSGTKASASIDRRMAEHRQRHVKAQAFGFGAGEFEKLAPLPEGQRRWACTVKLLRGAGLLAADDTGFSDPYCDVHVWCPADSACRHAWRSATCEQTLAPVWEKTDWRPAPLTSARALLHVVCCDWDRLGRDDFLGECLVDLSRYADGQPHTLELELDRYDDAPAGEPVTGHILIEVTLVDRRNTETSTAETT